MPTSPRRAPKASTELTLKLKVDKELAALLENEETGIQGVSLAPLLAELKKDKDGQISMQEIEAAELANELERGHAKD